MPVRDDRVLYEFLILEGAQAGLSWETILLKRQRYGEVFAAFDPAVVARFTPRRIDRVVADPGVVRNRRKIESAVTNARAFLTVQKTYGSFAAYLWEFVDGEPVTNRFERPEDVPANTPLSVSIARDLKGRGFSFVGPTIVYAYLQAVGVVNDHLVSCPRHADVQRLNPTSTG